MEKTVNHSLNNYTIIVDIRSGHNGEYIREKMVACGCNLQLIQPYGPNLNTNEKFFAQ